MHNFILIYFNNKLLHISRRLAFRRQEDQLWINSSWNSHALCWLAAGCKILVALFPSCLLNKNVRWPTNLVVLYDTCDYLQILNSWNWNQTVVL